MMNIIWMVIYLALAWILVSVASWGWMYLSARMNAQLLKSEAFETQSNDGQIIDVRDKEPYKRSHILGARNIPAINFSQGKAGLRKDKQIFLYDDNMRNAARAAKLLKKQGYKKDNLYILRSGFDQYTGKKTK